MNRRTFYSALWNHKRQATTSKGSNSPIIAHTFWSVAEKLHKVSTIPFGFTSRTISAITIPNLVQIGQLKVPENTIFLHQISGIQAILTVCCEVSTSLKLSVLPSSAKTDFRVKSTGNHHKINREQTLKKQTELNKIQTYR